MYPPSPCSNHTFVFYIVKSFCFVSSLVSSFRFHTWHTFVFVWLVKTKWISLEPSMLLQMAIFLSFLWLNNSPLCVYIYMCVCMSSYIWEYPNGQRSLAGYSPLDHKESDTSERLSTHTHSGRTFSQKVSERCRFSFLYLSSVNVHQWMNG